MQVFYDRLIWCRDVRCCAAFWLKGNVTDRDLEIDRDMEHESDTDYPRYPRFRKIEPTNWYLVPLNVVPWHRFSGRRNSKLGPCKHHVSLKTTCVQPLL